MHILHLLCQAVSRYDLLLERIRKIMPDLTIEHFERNQEGTLNDVLILNHSLVFRSAKNERYAGILQAETRILDYLRPRLDLQIPDPILVGPDYMLYPLLPGQPLLRNRLNASHASVRQSLAQQLGSFLHNLHSLDTNGARVDIPTSRAPTSRNDCLSLYADVKEKIFPLLQKDQVEWAEDLFGAILQDPGAFQYEPAFVHGDLASYHLLFDEQECRITGVFDFDMAGIGDPANDIGNLISFYGETFVAKMGPAYPNLTTFLPRARYYAQSLELEWILRGLESGENFWFTAHLARARDIFT